MAEYIRARSSEQKQERMMEIMQVTDQLFSSQTYHSITLTTIAASLGWSRGNLYKYVTTKEEIFLQLYLEKQQEYFEDLKAAFENKQKLSDKEFANIWADTLDRHHDYLKYYGILAAIIETNVTLERLVEFKKNVMVGITEIISIIKYHCNIEEVQASELFWTFLYHATGINNACSSNPMVVEAMKIAEIPRLYDSFTDSFSQFVEMCLRNRL
ncbi:MAG: TetR family transcriptional regulator [Lachnospiraceae bacterium]|nr:TetR family transcriptional regulator [Lachnospiraceae bacterium]